MPRHHSPYARRRRSRSSVPTLVVSILGLLVIVLGIFLIADQLGRPSIGSSPGNGNGGNATPGAEAGSQSTHAPAVNASPTAVDAARLKSAVDAAKAFVTLWNNSDYVGMYALLSSTAKQSISEKDFVARYTGIAQEVGQTSIEATLGNAPVDATRVPMHVVRQSAKVGKIEEDNVIPVVRDGDAWRVDWTPSLIFADLRDGFVRWKPDVPQRGRILDRKGRPLAALGTISKVGVIPGKIQDEQAMVAKLSELLGMTPDQVKAKYAGGQPDWFMPIKNYPDQMDPKLLEQLAAIPGVVVQKWPDRVYPAGPAAAQVVGYLSQITSEELPEKSKEGYSSGDMIGRAGIESWGEKYLSGKRGGRLVIVGSDGSERKVIAEVKSEPAADIVTTIDLDVQMAADQALGNRPGSIVVLDPSNGAVLAMVSHPSFDPNKFILGLTDQDWAEINNEQTRPLVNLATQGAYPSGSTFKVVTVLGAMVDLGMTPQTTVQCPGSFSLPEAPNQVYKDWSITGQGTLTLHNALVQSCDTVMYQIGADLDKKDPKLLPNLARAFGFGSPTGIPELPEVPGVVPDPDWKLQNVHDHWARGDAVNLSIGQGYFLATPLQVADAYAAIANGGTLWQPYVVQEVRKLDGTKVYTATPKERGKLPGTPEQLAAIRSMLKDVVNAPNGTAAGLSKDKPFAGETHLIAGKTGTAENVNPDPHSWFAAFSPVDVAKITAVVMAQNAGEGGDVAAPIDRKVIDAYYAANP